VTIRLDHLLISVLVLVLAVLALVFAAPRLLHHDGRKSFTVKMSVLGGEAYLVASVPAADFSALRGSVTSASNGFGSVYLTEQNPEGPRACSKSGRLGESGPLDPEIQPYAGDQVTIKIYGSDPLVDGLCQYLQQQGFGF
jgi:hypothetical protein